MGRHVRSGSASRWWGRLGPRGRRAFLGATAALVVAAAVAVAGRSAHRVRRPPAPPLGVATASARTPRSAAEASQGTPPDGLPTPPAPAVPPRVRVPVAPVRSGPSRAGTGGGAVPPRRATAAPGIALAPDLLAAIPDLQAPVDGPVLAGFGWSYSPVFRDWQEHTGVDLGAAPGTAVRAPADGVVVAVRDDPLWGWVVSLALPGGYTANVSGLGAVRVAKGAHVAAGAPLGTVGASPPAESDLPPHVLWQVFRGDVPVDPVR
jgi:murein DD-endopeptidase MepM/ murein hydrolase activator NlpD